MGKKISAYDLAASVPAGAMFLFEDVDGVLGDAGTYYRVDEDDLPGGGGGGDMTAAVYDAAGITEQVVGLVAAQTLTNKTLTSPVLTTPQINDTSADHQYIFAVNELVADRTVTLPLLTGNDTFVFNAFAATLTNKVLSLASNTLTGTTAQFNTALSDGSFATLAGAETLTNKTLTAPVIAQIVSVSDGNIDIAPNGTGNVLLGTFSFDADQSVGAGQDNYVMTYDHSSGLIGLEVAASGSGDVSKVGTPVNNELGVWTGDGTIEGEADLTYDGTELLLATADLVFTERADHAATPGAGFGYLWVKDDTPSALIYTDDAGTDFNLTTSGSGDVSKVGTPVNNELGVWTGDGTLEGEANLTFDGTKLLMTGIHALVERAASGADVATQLQIWAKDDAPNTLWFTNDAGTDFQVATLAGTETLTNKSVDLANNTLTGTTAQFNTALSDDSFAVLSGAVLTGTWDFGGADDLEIPNSATPTVDTDGQVAIDTTVSDFSHGVMKYYSGEEMAVVAMPVGELTTPANGAVPTYNSTNDEFEMAVPSGAGDVSKVGTPVNNELGVWTGDGTLEGESNLVYDGTTLHIVAADLEFTEKADHSSTPAAGRGYLWLKSDTPSALIFTDDAGTDFNLTTSGSGDVSKVGTPVNNELGVWTGDGTLEGEADLTYDGTTLHVAVADLEFTEKADHSSTPAAGRGYLWLKSDTPSALIFTDDAGTDFNLTTSGSGDVSAAAVMADHSIVRGNGGAKGVQDSGFLIDDSDQMSVAVTNTSTYFPFYASNASNAAAAQNVIRLENDASGNLYIQNFSSGFTSTDSSFADGANIHADAGMAGGLSLIAAGGDVRIFAGGTATADRALHFSSSTLRMSLGGDIVTNGPIYVVEQAAATADFAGYGQFWVKNDTPNTPMFTNDAGTDIDLSLTGGGMEWTVLGTPDAAKTGVAGQIAAWDISSFTADRAFTLPSTASVDDLVGIYITTGDADYEVEIKSDGAGSLINGVDHSSTPWSKLFITNEQLLLRCVKAGGAGDTDWIVEKDGRIPCEVYATRDSNITTNTAATATAAQFDNETTDIGDVYDSSTNYKVTLRRDGTWQWTCAMRAINALTDQKYYLNYVFNGATALSR